MYSIERQAEIISTLEEHGEVKVNDLAARFDISKETIRRDLTDLEKTGILVRTHGGAVRNVMENGQPKYGPEYPVAVRSIQHFNEKNRICRYAAGLIQDGDVLFLDNSSTTLYLLQYIPASIHVTVVTNSMRLLNEAAKLGNSNIHFYCLGGIFKTGNLSFYGKTTLEIAGQYFPNRAFLSCAGIREDGLLTDASMEEADTKRLMIDQSNEVILLADYTKFTSSGQVFLANMTGKFKIITDDKSGNYDFSKARKLGVTVTVI